jgi:hypothetical protein
MKSRVGEKNSSSSNSGYAASVDKTNKAKWILVYLTGFRQYPAQTFGYLFQAFRSFLSRGGFLEANT